jgi:Uma2 family endonuclease
MKTVVLGEMPPAIASLIAERQRLGLDRHDEIWEGDYHMVPVGSFEHASTGSSLNQLLGVRARTAGLVSSLEFNLGEPTDFRVPDLGFHRGRPSGVWISTAAVVVEVRSPGDESYEKFGFYFAHGVEEILIADLVTQTVQWYARGDEGFVSAPGSDLLGISAEEVRAALDW